MTGADDMINFFIEQCLNGLDFIYNSYLTGFFTKITEIFTYFQQYYSTFEDFMEIVYFIFGKGLIVFFLSACLTIIFVKIVFAIINLVGQFIP